MYKLIIIFGYDKNIMKNYNVNRMKYRAEIVKIEDEFEDGFQNTDENGNPITSLKPTGEVFWYGLYHVAITNDIGQNVPEHVQTTKNIVIRHETKINTDDLIKIESSYYRVIDIEPDDETNGLDVVTLVQYSANEDNNNVSTSDDYSNQSY